MGECSLYDNLLHILSHMDQGVSRGQNPDQDWPYVRDYRALRHTLPDKVGPNPTFVRKNLTEKYLHTDARRRSETVGLYVVLFGSRHLVQ
jgi:hypothetical protein